MKPDEVSARSWDQGRQPSDEVQRFEQNMGGAIAKGVFEFVDHQAVAVAAEALKRNGRARHVAAQSLQLPALVGPAGDRRIEREAVTRSREGLGQLRPLSGDPRRVQAKRPAPCDGAYGNPVTDGRTLELRERILTVGVHAEVEPSLLPAVVLLHNQRTASHKCARNAPDKRIEEALELDRRGWRDAVEARAFTLERVNTVERENMKVHV